MLTKLAASGLAALASMTFTMCEGNKAPAQCCSHGDTLNVVMKTQSVRRCNDMGGKPVIKGDLLICEDVDY